jgi:gp16 family phage-associated protein
MIEQLIKKQLNNDGITISEWAKKNGFNPALVYVVLAGKRKCLRGKSHEIAIRLGIKEPTVKHSFGSAINLRK